jgi:hypothetical protein
MDFEGVVSLGLFFYLKGIVLVFDLAFGVIEKASNKN